MGIWNRRAVLPLVALGLFSQAGCITRLFGGGEPSVEGSRGSVPLTKVERMVDSFADRQVTLIADACDVLQREAETADQRRWAHQLKLSNGSAVFDIITQPQTLARLADLYVLVELEYLAWAEEGAAYRKFGDRGLDRLVPAVKEARREMSRVADLAMKPERKQKFDALLRRWRERNPDLELVTGIRFGALPELEGKSLLGSAASFFDVINPMDETSESVERSRVLADRAFHFSKRLPRLLDWQTEAALDHTLAKPEIRGILEAVDRISRTVEELPGRVTREREEIFKAWDTREQAIRATIVDATELAVRAKEVGTAFQQTFRELHEVVGSSRSDPQKPPGRPFDIREYTEAAAQIREAAREGTTVVDGAKSLVDYIAWRVVGVLVLLFALVLLYRLVVARTSKPRPARETRFHRPPTTMGWPT